MPGPFQAPPFRPEVIWLARAERAADLLAVGETMRVLVVRLRRPDQLPAKPLKDSDWVWRIFGESVRVSDPRSRRMWGILKRVCVPPKETRPVECTKRLLETVREASPEREKDAWPTAPAPE